MGRRRGQNRVSVPTKPSPRRTAAGFGPECPGPDECPSVGPTAARRWATGATRCRAPRRGARGYCRGTRDLAPAIVVLGMQAVGHYEVTRREAESFIHCSSPPNRSLQPLLPALRSAPPLGSGFSSSSSMHKIGSRPRSGSIKPSAPGQAKTRGTVRRACSRRHAPSAASWIARTALRRGRVVCNPRGYVNWSGRAENQTSDPGPVRHLNRNRATKARLRAASAGAG